jgi:hypothetical protein
LSREDRLREAVDAATQEHRLVAVVAAAARTNWRASAWILSRRFPERWGERPRGDAVPVAFASDDDGFREVDQLAELRRRKRGEPPKRPVT